MELKPGVGRQRQGSGGVRWEDKRKKEEGTTKKRTRATATSDSLSGGIPYTSSLRQAVSTLGATNVSSNVTGKTWDTKSPSLSVSSDESMAQLPEDFQVNMG